MSEHATIDNEAKRRFEIVVAGTVAGFAEYRLGDGTIAFTHTVVEPAFEGQGIGSALAVGALDAARGHGLAVLPYCSFIRGYIARHPAYLDLVPAARRVELDLPADTATESSAGTSP